MLTFVFRFTQPLHRFTDELNLFRTHFSFYKSYEDRWKNSVRHNLSMSPYFRKGARAGRGAGHLWTLAAVEGRYQTRRYQTAQRMGRPPTTAGAGFTGDEVSAGGGELRFGGGGDDLQWS